MTLNFGQGQWENAKKSEDELKPIELPQNAPTEILPTLQIATPSQAQYYFREQQVLHPVLDTQNLERWLFKYSDEIPEEVELERIWLRGENFEERSTGVWEIKKGSAGQRLTNATVRISSYQNLWKDDDNFEEFVVCAVRCAESWGEEEKFLEISSKNYKKLFEIIRENFHDVQVSSKNPDAFDEYLSCVYRRDSKGSHLTTIDVAENIGWLKVNDQIGYHIGVSDFYKNYVFPNISILDRRQIFGRGFYFREVGHRNSEIELLWLFAHTAYTQYFFRKSDIPFQTLLFLKGKTNVKKTSTMAVLANVFLKDREKTKLALSSTAASIRDYVLAHRDNLLLVDDFSNTIGANNSQMEKNAELLIRAIGEGRFASKLSVSATEKVQFNIVRASVVITGEEDLNLSPSSLARIITVPVDETSFDGRFLEIFQSNPEILREYFALYIEFLRENYVGITNYCKNNFYQYRNNFSEQFELPRFADFAAAMKLQAEIIGEFVVWCEADENFAKDYSQGAILKMLQMLRQHQDKSSEQDLSKKFLYALFQSLNTTDKTKVASSENDYIKNESGFIGFLSEDSETIWLKFDDAYSMVVKFYERQKMTWTVQAQTVKEELLNRDISHGKKVPKGQSGTEYLVRAKKGSRKRMLVLRLEAVDKILNPIKEMSENV